ncbi:MAG: DUF61 family protein [Candidatus Kariarchaeaceae archaeon]|jgi:uncharacterized protein (UPF0216 family)
MSDRLSRVLQSEIDKINLHLPKKVISLRQVQLLSTPGVYLRDGQFTPFDEDELKKIQKLIPEQYWGHVLLPIIITRRRDLGDDIFTVGGSDVNLYLVQQAYSKLPIYDIWRVSENKENIVYKYNLRKIRKELNTTSVIAIT